MIELETLRGRILKIEEVALLLGIKPDSVRRRIRIGALPAKPIAGTHKRLILGDDLIAYLKGESQPESERADIAKPMNSLFRESEEAAMEGSKLYSLPQVARFLGKAEPTISYHIKKGTLKASIERHGGQNYWKISHADLEAFLKKYNPEFLDKLPSLAAK